MLFSPFFVFRPWPKRGFCCFLLIRRGGKPIFSVFCPLYPYERLFLPFFIDCTPTKRGFSRFLLVVGVRKTVFRRFLHFVGRRRAFFSVFLRFVSRRRAFFCIFWLSEVSESYFFPFSTHPRSRKAIFSNFPLIRGLGQSFLSAFCLRRLSKLKQILKPRFMFYE